jgi:hypothetical protein
MDGLKRTAKDKPNQLRNMKLPPFSLLLVACSAIPTLSAIAQQPITVVNAVVTQNFNALPASGADLPATGGIFEAGWRFLENGTNKNLLFQAGNGSSNTGDTYSFGASASSDRAFGLLQSGSLTSIIGYQFSNNTGQTIASLRIGFTGELWRLSAAPDGLAFSYQIGDLSLDAGTGWIPVPALQFTSPLTGSGAVDGNNGAYRNEVQPITVTGLAIPPGATVTFRWVDATPTNSAGMAIDDFSLTLYPAYTGYFRSRSSGDWNDPASWEVSSNGLTWSPATAVVPSGLAAGITIGENHTITVSGNVTGNQITVLPGGKLLWSAGTFTIADAPGEDLVLQGEGSEWEVATNAVPTLLGAASVRIGQGAILKLSGTSQLLAFHGNAYTYANGSVCEYNYAAAPLINGTFFSGQDAGAIPLFRYNSPVTTSLGSSGPTVVNGSVEIMPGRTFNLNGVGGSLVMRNGLTGDGHVSSVNPIQFTGTTAILGGGGTFGSHLAIGPGCTTTVLSDKVFSAGRNITVNGVLDFESRQFRTVSGTATLANGATGVLKTANPAGLLSEGGSLKTGAFTLNFAAGSTVAYTDLGNQVLSILNVPAYQNLVISGTGIKLVQGGNLVVQASCAIQPGATLALTGNASENLYLNNNASLAIEAGATFDNVGESSITTSAGTPSILIMGTFRTKDAQGFTGPGAAIPSIVPILSPGSTVDYARAGDQVIQATVTYHHLACSGAGSKTPTNALTLNGTVTINEAAVLNGGSHTIGGPANNLVMTGSSRLIVGVTGTQPSLGGSYSLAPGTTIEFANNNSTTAFLRQGSSPAIQYANIDISGSNLTAPHSGISLQAGATLTVRAGGVLKLTSVNGLLAPTGAALLTTHSPTLVLEPGSTIEYSGGAQTITSNMSYSHLTISGTGAKTAAAPFYISQTFTRSGDATLNGSSPVYAAGASLAYADATAGRTYAQGMEWPEGNPPQDIKINLTGSGLPAIRLNRNQSIAGELSILAGALDLNGHRLEITGSITGAGTLTGSSASALSLHGGNSTLLFTQSHDGSSNALASLKVRDGMIRLGNRLQIYEVLDIAGGTLDLADQSLVLKSGPGGTAMVTEKKGGLQGASRVTVERYVNGSFMRRWRLLTAPVTGSSVHASWQEGRTWSGGAIDQLSPGYGTLITGQQQGSALVANAAGFDFWPEIAGSQASIRRYQGGSSSASASWQPLSSTLLYNFDNSQAYLLFIRGDRSVSGSGNGTVLRSTGALREQHSYSIPIHPTQSHTLIGNPYASPLHFRKLYETNAGIIKPYFWIWQASLSSTGGYALVKPEEAGSTTYEVIPANSGSNGPVAPIIQSGEGFFVMPVEAPVASYLTVQQSHKTLENTTLSVLRQQEEGSSKLYINLLVAENNVTILLDGVLLQFQKPGSGTSQLNIGKALNNSESISIYQSGSECHVAEIAPPSSSAETPLRLWRLSNRNYQLQVRSLNFKTPGLGVWLWDHYLDKETPLMLGNETTVYSFTVNSEEASRDPFRFRIIYRVARNLPLPLRLTVWKAAQKGGGVQLEWEAKGEEGLRSYTLEHSRDGRKFLPLSTLAARGGQGPNDYHFLDRQRGEPAFYRLNMEAADGSFQYSEVIHWEGIGGKEGVRLFPNPVRGGKLQLQLLAKPKGRYSVCFYTADGKAVWQQSILHAGGTAILVLKPGISLSSGIYTVTVRHGGGKVERFPVFYMP